MRNSLLHDEIYPALFAQAANVLPEFGFKPTQGGWVATAKLDIDGTPTKAGGKVYWYHDHPQSLWSHKQQQALSLWDYIANRDYLNPQDSKVVLKHLAELAGVTLQPPEQGRGKNDSPKPKGIHPGALQDALPWLQEQLWTNPEANAVRDYLHQTRGYSEEDCRAMGLGFFGDREALAKHLEARGHSNKAIGFFLQLDRPAHKVPFASTHRLVIPVYGKHQILQGFSYRATTPGAEPKYRNAYALPKAAALLDYPHGETHIVLVEGYFDALLAKVKGMSNVVPMIGNKIGLAQLQALQENGIRSITLCSDNDQGGADGRKVMMKTLTDNQVPLQVYIARLPTGVKDPDAFIQQHGIHVFRSVLHQAQSMGRYIGQRLASQYVPEEMVEGVEVTQCSPQERDRFLYRCATVESKLLFPVDVADFQDALQPALEHFQLSPLLYEKSVEVMVRVAKMKTER